jgi:hypothetical protein
MALTLDDHDRRLAVLEQAHGETTQTLRWVVTKLARMQAAQDEHTLRLERLETKVDRLDGRLGKVETQLEALPRAIAEMIEASERRIMAAVAGRT